MRIKKGLYITYWHELLQNVLQILASLSPGELASIQQSPAEAGRTLGSVHSLIVLGLHQASQQSQASLRCFLKIQGIPCLLLLWPRTLCTTPPGYGSDSNQTCNHRCCDLSLSILCHLVCIETGFGVSCFLLPKKIILPWIFFLKLNSPQFK